MLDQFVNENRTKLPEYISSHLPTPTRYQQSWYVEPLFCYLEEGWVFLTRWIRYDIYMTECRWHIRSLTTNEMTKKCQLDHAIARNWLSVSDPLQMIKNGIPSFRFLGWSFSASLSPASSRASTSLPSTSSSLSSSSSSSWDSCPPFRYQRY